MVQDNMDFLDIECPFCDANYGSDFDIDAGRLQLIRTCKDGTAMPIEEMTTRHIKNCISKITRSVNNDKPWRVEYLMPLIEELKSRQLVEALRTMPEEEFNKIVHKGKK